MAGRAKIRKNDEERRLWLAYHSGMFAAVAQSGKLKPFKHYWQQMFGNRTSSQALLSAFMAMQDRGYAMNIKKLN